MGNHERREYWKYSDKRVYHQNTTRLFKIILSEQNQINSKENDQ